MAVRTYATDEDMMKLRPKILSHGVEDWNDQHVEAADIIEREIENKWYRDRAIERGKDPDSSTFNPNLLDGSQVKRAAVYKALELAYLFLMSDTTEPGAFEREMLLFRDLFEDELRRVLVTGLGYDWDASGGITASERRERRYRRLRRM